MDHRSHGLLLQSKPFLGAQKILKVLTPDAGLISLIAKQTSAGRSISSALTTPFLVAEWVYRPGRREIHALLEGALLDDFSALKNDYRILSAAGEIAQALLATQLPGKAAAEPFALALAYLKKLALVPNPEVLAASFQLKLLVHEGMFHLAGHCSQCSAQVHCFSSGEGFCRAHAPVGAFECLPEEIEYARALLQLRTFSELASLPHIPKSCQKFKEIFNERVCRS